jgi:undecaprenyl-diphosphatase
LDRALFRLLRTHGHAPVLWQATALAGAALDRRRRAEWLQAWRTIVLAYLANQAIKFAVRRPRPDEPGLPPLVATHSRLSYPSAHAATSAAAARSLDGLLPAAPLYALAGVVASSRPYLGVHYPSDTLAGLALGAAIAELRR